MLQPVPHFFGGATLYFYSSTPFVSFAYGLMTFSSSNATTGGTGRLLGATRGLVDAFVNSTRVQEWLDHQQNERRAFEEDPEADLSPLQGPWGRVHMRPLPAVVWVSLQSLEMNPEEHEGVTEVAGEPMQRW